MRNKLIAAAIAVATISTGAAQASACPAVHRVTLPALQVHQPYCTATRVIDGHVSLPRVPHVHFDRIGSWESPRGNGYVRYAIEAHTTSSAYRWQAHRQPGPGWQRFNRRTATFVYDLPDVPACVFSGEDPTI